MVLEGRAPNWESGDLALPRTCWVTLGKSCFHIFFVSSTLTASSPGQDQVYVPCLQHWGPGLSWDRQTWGMSRKYAPTVHPGVAGMDQKQLSLSFKDSYPITWESGCKLSLATL